MPRYTEVPVNSVYGVLTVCGAGGLAPVAEAGGIHEDVGDEALLVHARQQVGHGAPGIHSHVLTPVGARVQRDERVIVEVLVG